MVTGEAAEEEGETEAGRLGHAWGGVEGCCKNDPEAHFSVTRASGSNLGKETGSNVFRRADRVERPSHHLHSRWLGKAAEWQERRRANRWALESGLSLNLTALWPFYFVGQ